MHRRSHTFLIAGFSFTFVAAMLDYARPAAATVTWDFDVTSLIFVENGQPVPGFAPHVAGTLTMSDADFLKGGISYSATSIPGIGPPYSVVGDTDFSFLVGASILPVTLGGLFGPYEGTNSISIVTTPSGIISSGSVSLVNDVDGLIMKISNNFAIGFIGTDIDTLGCPDSMCNFTGVWSGGGFPVPEPGSVGLLTTALGLLGYLVARRTRPRL